MKKLLCVFVLAAFAFAQDAWEEGKFVQGELAFLTTESGVVSDGGNFDFTVEAIGAEPVFEVVDREETNDIEAAVDDIEAVDETFKEEIAFERISIETIDEERFLEDELPKILFTVDEGAQIICEFMNSSEDKIIEVVCISEGKAVLEISASAAENLISIPLGELNSGIYIVRVLSPQKKSSLFSKAVVIG